MFQFLFDFISGVFSGRWTQRFLGRKAAASRSPWRKRARFSREVLLADSKEVAHSRIRGVLASMGTLRDAPEIDALEAVTNAGVRSTGTVIHVQLVGVDDRTRVEVAAWPGAQLFDWGESRRVVDRVIAALGPTLPLDAPVTARFR